MKNLKNTIPKHIFNFFFFFKNPSTFLRVIRKNENPPKERERESNHNFLGKNMDWMREIISNLYKIKCGEEGSKYKKEKMMKEM